MPNNNYTSYVRLPLGKPESKDGLEYDGLLEQAIARGSLVAGGQELLSFLSDPKHLMRSKTIVDKGQYVKLVPIPSVYQMPLWGSPLRRRSAQYPSIKEQADRVLQCKRMIERSADVCKDVSVILSSCPDIKEAIDDLERRTGCDTSAARSFLYQQKGTLFVEVDGEKIDFESPATRKFAPNGKPIEVKVRLDSYTPAGGVWLGSIKMILSDEPTEICALLKVRQRQFRFSTLLPWQEATLASAAHLNVLVHMLIQPMLSATSLSNVAADVLKILGWDVLVSEISEHVEAGLQQLVL